MTLTIEASVFPKADENLRLQSLLLVRIVIVLATRSGTMQLAAPIKILITGHQKAPTQSCVASFDLFIGGHIHLPLQTTIGSDEKKAGKQTTKLVA